MVVVIVVLVAVVVLALVAGVLVTRLRRPVAEPPVRRSTITAAAPFTGLESALDQVTGDGRKLRDKIEGETAIDDLRVVDDSGPILRRALDHVEHSNENTHVDHGRVDAGDLPPVAKSEPPVTPPVTPAPPDQSPA